jgi:AcrR family transcriptional regulator
MPRKPDPGLEDRIVEAALRLLDRAGEDAITMRSVAVEAGTTTPTLYERFGDRDALMRRLVELSTDQVLATLSPKTSVEDIFGEYLRFSVPRPTRFNLTVETFGARLVTGDKMPVYELLKVRTAEQLGISGIECEDLALAITSLAFGTVRGMIAAGEDTRHARDLERTSLQALRVLLNAFSAREAGE